MTVFVAHAPADRAAAEALERALERRGQFVELDDGVTALRPVEAGDVLVLLVSQALQFATARLRLEQRALDAWADGRLVTVRLDQAPAPVGLRDLPAVDMGGEPQRDADWSAIADTVRDRLGQSQPAAPARAGRAAPWRVIFALALFAAGAAGLWRALGPAQAPEPWLAAAALALALGVVLLIWAALGRRPRAPAEPDAPKQSSAVFVSYARANAGMVLPVIDAAKRAGRKFWLDQSGAGGETERAIRGSAGVVVMCSTAAFQSDQVKREVFLADRYGKKLAPVFIEAAEPPEDFEYFFAGAQPLKLFETPEAERPQALVKLLGAAS